MEITIINEDKNIYKNSYYNRNNYEKIYKNNK